MREFLIIGLGRFGSVLAQTLYDLGHEVVGVDVAEDAVARVMNHVTHAVVLDATDEVALHKLGVGSFDHVVITIGSSLEASVLAAVVAKTAGAKNVIAKATSPLSARVLSSVGADEVVQPEHDMGVRLAKQLDAPDIMDSFALGANHGVVELETHGLSGTLNELKLPKRFGIQVIAVTRLNRLEIIPSADFELLDGDRVLVLGANEDIDKLRKFVARA